MDLKTAPARVVRPASRDELAETLREAQRDKLTVLPRGGGVGLAHEPAPERCDLILDMTALDRIVEYDPEDLTLTAECGVTLATLRSTLAARGQELPLEGARIERATLGGAIAGDASGARRMHLGGPRDRILGARFVLADGTVARSGGKVVKNVAGYGTHRLLCGSRGGLAIVVEASLKLLPAPEARRALIFDLDRATLADGARWSAWTRAELAVMTLLTAAAAERLPDAARGGSSGDMLILGLEGDLPWVEQKTEEAARAFGTPRDQRSAAEAERLWQALADLEDTNEPRLELVSPHKSPAALADLRRSAPDMAMMFHAPHGRLHVWPGAGGGQVMKQANAAGFTLRERFGFEDVTLAATSSAGVGVDALRRRIRQAFDPTGVLALGNRWERA